MGTSASNGGPKGTPPLLPDWYDEFPPLPPQPDTEPEDPNTPPEPELQPDDNPQPNPEKDQPPLPNESKDWKNSKGALTRRSNNTGGASNSKAGQKYVKSLGGARGATRAARQGVRTGTRFAGFLGAVASGGIAGALSFLGLTQFIGRSSEETCVAIANAIAPAGNTNDEAIAREAIITTLDSLQARLQESGENLESLATLTLEQIKETLIDFVSNFIFTKWMYELGNAIERGSVTETEAIALEAQVKDLIYVETTEQYRDVEMDKFDLNNTEIHDLIEEIFQTAYSTLEE